MNLPRKQPERGLYGPVWTEFNKIVDYVRSITPFSGRGVRINRTVNGTTLVAEIPRLRALPVRQFRLSSIQNDFYTCFEWDGSAAGSEEIYIARPFEHRVSNFNGQTIAYSSDGDAFSATFAYTSATKRTKTISGTAETQVIIPYYKTGFTLIYAIDVGFDITAGPSNTPITDPNDEPIRLLDLNVDGRAWTKL